ncbi:MAG: replicative DNA helicase [Candidatus Eisenbacteria bacterium]|uniref:Replicative DNA helicase n=1 Tax=Eiseniibacteriota bacterium TaxID=2212470 RepID=A0A948S023_UNCEI|nr:replicative DNA helicase [Candidatus Eisenbacteria bacterium]MBU1948314.1 replicative DNA helicase [Candidatus Eisenbacteria bacterium]MBU2693106.1 replicative DNA helicase [Candidatus Eisenbacteria bacterium]
MPKPATDLIGKVPPQNIDAEVAVLGAMLLAPEAVHRAEEILTEDVFYRESNRRVFNAIVALSERSEAADIITVTEELRRQGCLEEVGGASYVATLVDAVSTAANIEYHSKLVVDKAVLRRLITAATQIVEKAYTAGEPPAEIVDWAEQLMFGITSMGQRREFVPIKELLTHTFEIIQELYEQKRVVTGVPTGYQDLDRMTAGFQPSDLIIIAGRPSMGKTSLALNMAENAAIKHKLPVAIFSLEMSRDQLVQRLLCSQAHVEAHRLRTGFLKESEWPLLTDAAGRLAEAPIYIDDTPGISLMEMRAKARRLKAKFDLKMLIVDYLQLARGYQNPESRQQEISQISRGLKSLAKELEVPVVALSQLSRAVEARENRRPVLSDLRESGAIEQDADVVMFIYREEVYKPDKEEVKGIAEIIIGKHRNGPTGTIPLAFLNQFTRFESLARIDDEYSS